jgi:endonuclease/exonuclease/phosphatase family metal-dependent hydrolase
VSAPLLACALGVLGTMGVVGCAAPADRLDAPEPESCAGPARHPSFRVMTWNIKWATLVDSDLDAIAAVVRRAEADGVPVDILALQEVDAFAPRSNEEHQADALAARLGMRSAFAAARTEGDGGVFGNALLTRFGVVDVDRVDLIAGGAFEPRAALLATLCIGNRPRTVVSTHIDFVRGAGDRMVEDLVDVIVERPRGRIVMGDFNAYPDEPPGALMDQAGFVDAAAAKDVDTATSGNQRIDYVYVDSAFAVVHAAVVDAPESDHDAVVVDVEDIDY